MLEYQTEGFSQVETVGREKYSKREPKKIKISNQPILENPNNEARVIISQYI